MKKKEEEENEETTKELVRQRSEDEDGRMGSVR